MYPLLLVSQDKNKVEEYISTFKKNNQFSEYSTYTIEPAKTELTIDQIREIQRQVITIPSSPRLFILQSFDTASLEAQNAFLKTLEERTTHNQFILVVSHKDSVLPTIQSRSSAVVLVDEAKEIPQEIKSTLMSLIESPNTNVFSHAIFDSATKESVVELLSSMLIVYRTMLTSHPQRVTKILKKVLETLRLLQHNNLNPQLALDSVLIAIYKS